MYKNQFLTSIEISNLSFKYFKAEQFIIGQATL